MAGLFSVARVASLLETWKLPATSVSEDGLVLDRPDGRIEVSVEQVDVPSMDHGRVREVVRVEHRLAEEVGPISAEFAARWNHLASLSALLPTRGRKVPRVFSKIPVWDGDVDAANTLYPHIVAASAYQMSGVANYMKPGRPSAGAYLSGLEEAPGTSFFGTGDVPDRSTAEEFAEAQRSATKYRFVATCGPSELTAEFPFDEGAANWGMRLFGGTKRLNEEDSSEREIRGGETMLLTIRSDTNPLFGSGLFSLLRFPCSLRNLEESALVAVQLNEWEFAHAEMVPSLGAWTRDGAHGIAYVSFVPGAFHYPGMVRNVFWWMAGRANRARQWLQNAALATPVRIAERKT
jgi:hypothetical protein